MNLHNNESPAASWLNQSPAASWMFSKLNGAVNVSPRERTISKVAGGLMLLNAFVRPRPLSLLGGLIGGALLSRGVTGHCPVYSAFGKSTATGADATPSQFAANQAESTLQAHTATPHHDAAARKLGLSDANTTTGLNSPTLNKPIEAHKN